ncbi:hypothetical protein M9H77_12484 [Catharanthus roseus]|uniref:Uncharacterized protein n=1 Tax=Catharanthus roseus TaxID=4058 RepID=A0ACC0BHL4_CATRO|nr:hypothetical protein M9H77_12484 [Catharanthus roseus]
MMKEARKNEEQSLSVTVGDMKRDDQEANELIYGPTTRARARRSRKRPSRVYPTVAGRCLGHSFPKSVRTTKSSIEVLQQGVDLWKVKDSIFGISSGDEFDMCSKNEVLDQIQSFLQSFDRLISKEIFGFKLFSSFKQ